jgi:hypothetical protein
MSIAQSIIAFFAFVRWFVRLLFRHGMNVYEEFANSPDFTSDINIIGLSLEEAKAIVRQDTWFCPANRKVQRFIKAHYDNYGNVVKIERKNTPCEGYILVDTNFDPKAFEYENLAINEGMMAAFLFSVHGNNGPFKAMKALCEKAFVAVPTETNEKMFWGHLSYLLANGAIGIAREWHKKSEVNWILNDPLTATEITIDEDFTIPSLEQGKKDFVEAYQKAFETFKKAVADQTAIENPRIQTGLQQDLTRFQSYMGLIQA